MNESCVETPAAPEWLSKLESRREKLTKRRLGHETGAGAPCNVCGDKCPGLDLHFWRKVCRNCKCRKEQHECHDDDLSGWAQFEILGQIRSKPAYINLKTFADNPVKVDWIPPNAENDIINDYMKQLGSDKIPIAGSDAAAKRKQQLEFQVPAHDLDPTLCDNLTENEQEQLKQYADKLKENCVGQGNIVRIAGDKNILQHTTETQPITPVIYKDKMASFIMNSDIVKGILQNPSQTIIPKGTILQSKVIPMVPDFHQSPILSDKVKYKLNLMKINSQGIQSGTLNGPFYDKILSSLKEQNINYNYDNILKPLDDFRNVYNMNDNFRDEVNNFVNTLGDRFLDTIPELAEEEEAEENMYNTPKKENKNLWNSPLPIKNIPSKQGQIVQQETPMRKVQFGRNPPNNNIQELYNPNTGYPIVPSIERDKILSTLLNSEPIQAILQNPSNNLNGTNLKISKEEILPDYLGSPYISDTNKRKLNSMNINSQGIQSGVLHGWAYDKIFPDLKTYNVNYQEDSILPAIEKFRNNFLNDEPFRNEMQNYVKTLGDSMLDNIPLSDESYTGEINKSKSSDSGFESTPPTPNYATYPGLELFKAYPGQFLPVHEIEDMPMHPNITPTSSTLVSNDFAKLNINPTANAVATNIMCQHCKKEIKIGEVAVKAERAGKDESWHPQCFVCNKCGELLADLVYFFHGGKVYCARDLAVILKIPRCHACDELIFTKEYTLAEGKTFHIKHFCCYQCDKPLAGQKYLPDETTNMPLCFKCFEEFRADRCNRCKKPIGAMEQGVAWKDIHWHGDCFICEGVNCGKSLIGGRFCVKNEMPFCSPQCVKSIIN